jgi:hypothetical protein
VQLARISDPVATASAVGLNYSADRQEGIGHP